MTDWQIGDLALCVDDGPLKDLGGYSETNPRYVANLRSGAIYTITHICRGNYDPSFVGIGDASKLAGGWEKRFVKVTPDEPDEFDIEVIYGLTFRPSPVFTPEAIGARIGERIAAVEAAYHADFTSTDAPPVRAPTGHLPRPAGGLSTPFHCPEVSDG